jgi:ribosomal-protein-alanine N-acetyltransferase
MTLADVDAVMAIEQAAYAFAWTRGNVVDSVLAGHRAELLCDAHGELLGYSIASWGVEEMHLLNLTVAPDHQGRGHALVLLDALVREAREGGALQLWLEVRPSNERARRVYERYGFVHVGVRRGYYPAAAGLREDALVMRLALASARKSADGGD